jgi:FkbM family methyltransferase
MPEINKILRLLPKRFHPLLRGAYQTIFFTEHEGRMRTFDVLSEFISDTCPVVVECGAYHGASAEKFLNIFDNPTIHAVEPVPKHVEVLSEKFAENENVIIHETAIGSEEDTIEISVTKKTNSSSVFEQGLFKKYQDGNPEVYDTAKRAEVRQVAIDTLVENADIIKLDMEGYELNALRGAEDVLNQCKCVVAEVSFVPLRSGQPIFTDIDLFLQDTGFHLYDFDTLRRGTDGQLIVTHAIWFSKEFYSHNDVLIYDPSD